MSAALHAERQLYSGMPIALECGTIILLDNNIY